MLGTSVLTPTFRYNPAVIAQAFATMGCLYPGRIFLGARRVFDSFCRRLAAANTEPRGQSFLAKRVRFQLLLIRISAVFEAPMPSVDAIAITPTTPTRQTPWRSARGAGIWRFFGLSGRVRTSGLGLTGPCRSRH